MGSAPGGPARPPWLALACAVLALLPGPRPAEAARGEITVFAAASLGDAFGAIARDFERRHPGLRVRLNLAGSQQLAAQIEQGAPADVFASADERWMDRLAAAHLLAGAPARFARNRLAVIVPRSNPARLAAPQDLARPGLRLVLAADAVPAGRYARLALARLAPLPGYPPHYLRRVLANVASEEENVKSVVAKVQLGEADAGIVYRSDVTPAVARAVRTIALPPGANVTAVYPIAVLAGARDRRAARAFVALVRSAEGRAALERAGFEAPAERVR